MDEFNLSNLANILDMAGMSMLENMINAAKISRVFSFDKSFKNIEMKFSV